MNTQAYIDSGILEEYCLGLLPVGGMQEVERMCRQYPGIRAEKESIEAGLEQQAKARAIAPPPALEDQIWGLLENLNREKQHDLSDLPLINRFSDHKNWLRIVQPLLPPKFEEERTVQVLRADVGVIQMLVQSKTDFEDEVHRDEYESFIILEGECECRVGDHVFRLGPGGFTEIPLHTAHDVRILTPHVTAILQRVAV